MFSKHLWKLDWIVVINTFRILKGLINYYIVQGQQLSLIRESLKPRFYSKKRAIVSARSSTYLGSRPTAKLKIWFYLVYVVQCLNSSAHNRRGMRIIFSLVYESCLKTRTFRHVHNFQVSIKSIFRIQPFSTVSFVKQPKYLPHQ